MIPINITEAEKLGLIYIKLLENRNADSNRRYFAGVNKLQELHSKQILLNSIKGYYLSLWNDGGIRFSYFTNNIDDSEKYLKEKFSSIGFEEYLPSIKPHEESYNYYLGSSKSNLEFRRFLLLITNIGMDLLKFDVNYSRRLVAEYRLEIAPSGISSKPYFEAAFNKLPYYNSLNGDLKNELFNGLDYWHTHWEDWAHMLVVMLLPGDWIYTYTNLFNPRRPIDKSICNRLWQELLSKDLHP